MENDNIGLRVILNALKLNGYSCAACDAYTAIRFDVVMVAINSTYDIVSFLMLVRELEWWRKRNRKFKVIAGGSALTNPTSIRDFVDFAIFGRCEDWIVEIIDDVLCGRQIVHESVMCLPDIHPVKMGKVARLYPSKIGQWQEVSIGCPYNCAYCLYKWTRGWIGTGNAYSNLSLSGEHSPELMFLDLLKISHKLGRVRCAIDGFSERLRMNYGKHIQNDDIINVIEHIGSFGPNATVLTVYNICNFPGETQDDIAEFTAIVRQARPKNRVIFVLHSTPFRPSNCTPMMWEAADITDRAGWRKKRLVNRNDLLVTHSFTIESDWSHLLTLLIERATIESDGAVWYAISLEQSGKMKSHAKVLDMKKNFPWAVEDATRQYDIGSSHHPCHMVRGVYQWGKVESRARRVRTPNNGMEKTKKDAGKN